MDDASKHLRCFVSFDPAIDDDAMGARYHEHFGRIGAPDVARAGTRDPSLVKVRPGMRACVFHLRPLTIAERFDCDAVIGVEHRVARALCYALVRAELYAPLSATATTLFAAPTTPGFSLDALTELMGHVGYEAVLEIGTVAYTRSWLGPFGVPFAPLLLTSAQRRAILLLLHADTLARKKSATPSSAPASPSPKAASETSEPPGDATAPESVEASPGPAPPSPSP